jgi:hypothetical protein
MRSRSRSSRGEAGETLAELLVTISILGLAVVVLVGALGTAITASTSHRALSTADTLARSIAETLKNPDPSASDAYVSCAREADYQIPSSIDTTGYTPTLTITYWKRGASAARQQSEPKAPSDFVESCPTRDQGLQLIKIAVTSKTSKAESATVSILKRRISGTR